VPEAIPFALSRLPVCFTNLNDSVIFGESEGAHRVGESQETDIGRKCCRQADKLSDWAKVGGTILYLDSTRPHGNFGHAQGVLDQENPAHGGVTGRDDQSLHRMLLVAAPPIRDD
jgi:hypothetical protein